MAVTGGSGKVGRAAVKALLAAGHRVANFAIKPSPDGVRTTVVDFTDYGQAVGALSGVVTVGGRFNAVVHLAGIPGTGLATDHTILATNTLSTFNVFDACRRLSVNTVVRASSETLLGLPFETPPPFAPLDESVMRSEWSDSLSKQMGEVMAETFARWSPDASISSLRFSNVYEAGDYALAPKIRAQPETRRGEPLELRRCVRLR